MRGLILLSCMLLAGCGDSGGTNGDDGAAASASRDSKPGVLDTIAGARVKPKAGRWEASGKMVDIDAPGIPANQKQALMDMMGGGMNFAYCVTPEQAAQDPASVWQKSEFADCDYSDDGGRSGHIAAKAVCTKDGQTMTMSMEGDYDATSYNARNTFEGDPSSGMGRMVFQVEGHHVGACDGSEISQD